MKSAGTVIVPYKNKKKIPYFLYQKTQNEKIC